MFVSAILAAAGSGTRFGSARPKQLVELAGKPMLQYSIEALVKVLTVQEILVALSAEEFDAPPEFLRAIDPRVKLVRGGARRQDSVSQAFHQLSSLAEIVVIHDAARPLVRPSLITNTIAAAAEHGAATAAVSVVDTVKRGSDRGLVIGTIPRGEVFLAQTPQAFRVGVLREALALPDVGETATDEAMLAEAAGHSVRLVPGDARNLKITTPEDLDLAERLMMNLFGLRIGNGYDLHRLSSGRPLVLGGVTIPFDKGLQGHSDGDAVCHAVTDALLGAARAGDIGQHFPDSDATHKGSDSLLLLSQAAKLVRATGCVVVSIDVVVIAERPKIAPFLEQMRKNLADALGVERDRIGVKGKTNEGCDSMGAGQSMAVHAVALLVAGSPSDD